MSRLETVAQRARRKRVESGVGRSLGIRRGGDYSAVGSLPVQTESRGLGCWAQALLIATPILIDLAVMTYGGVSGNNELIVLGLAGLPIAGIISFVMANSS